MDCALLSTEYGVWSLCLGSPTYPKGVLSSHSLGRAPYMPLVCLSCGSKVGVNVKVAVPYVTIRDVDNPHTS